MKNKKQQRDLLPANNETTNYKYFVFWLLNRSECLFLIVKTQHNYAVI
ncbi:hypothetical protein PROVRETT_09485 [Providencia rettgeri DSM 1131]|nr:hypothetical protein PROVRETT_09485 [Providencia rettgeri DSM 1131]